jgi:FMN phosphatase YigB (HAD superfamily)
LAIRAVLFDLGGVLLPFDRDRRVQAIARRTGADSAAVRTFMASDLHLRLDNGTADEAELAAGFSELARRAVSPYEACELVLCVFQTPNMTLWSLADRLKARFTVGGFSDNPPLVRRAFPAGATLDPLFLSSELGLTKPSIEAFETVQAQLGLPPDAILFIDDTLANIEQARRMGWDGIVFVSNEQLLTELANRGIE